MYHDSKIDDDRDRIKAAWIASRRGDEDAFNLLYKLAREILHALKKDLGDDAEDALHSALFWELRQNGDLPQNTENFKGFIFRMARNFGTDEMRRRARHRRLSSELKSPRSHQPRDSEQLDWNRLWDLSARDLMSLVMEAYDILRRWEDHEHIVLSTKLLSSKEICSYWHLNHRSTRATSLNVEQLRWKAIRNAVERHSMTLPRRFTDRKRRPPHTEHELTELHNEIQSALDDRCKRGGEPPAAGGRSGDEPLMTLPRLRQALRFGFTRQEEALASDDLQFQRLVRLAWRFEPPSMWMLVRYLSEGASFPFKEAMRLHLEEEEGSITNLSLLWGPAIACAKVLASLKPFSTPWKTWLDKMVAWEQTTWRSLVVLPSNIGAFATEAPKPFSSTSLSEDGCLLTVEHATAAPAFDVVVELPPSRTTSPSVSVALVGRNDTREAAIDLVGGTYAVVGRTSLGRRDELGSYLGKESLVLVTSSELPVPAPE